MIKLTYTNEMKIQDVLWEDEREDLSVMERLQRTLVDDAIRQGWTGYANIYIACKNEVIAELYKDKESDEDVKYSSNCIRLIKNLENTNNMNLY